MNSERSVKIFDQLYVGISPVKPIGPVPLKYETTPLAFATPFEKNKAFEKRKSTVDKWLKSEHSWKIDDAGNYIRDKDGRPVESEFKSSTIILENTPREGFKITDNIKRTYWGGGNVVFRVEDPAGFELEIQSQNLMTLIRTCGINAGGAIPGKCIWGREGKDNILIHEDSDIFRNAIDVSSKKTTSTRHTTRQIGSSYVLQNGNVGVYLGKVYAATSGTNYIKHCVARIVNHDYHSVKDTIQKAVRHINEVKEYEAVKIRVSGKDYITLYRKAPLIKRQDEKALTIEEVKSIFRDIPNESLIFASGRFELKSFLSLEKPTALKFSASPISDNNFNYRIEGVKNAISEGMCLYLAFENTSLIDGGVYIKSDKESDTRSNEFNNTVAFLSDYFPQNELSGERIRNNMFNKTVVDDFSLTTFRYDSSPSRIHSLLNKTEEVTMELLPPISADNSKSDVLNLLNRLKDNNQIYSVYLEDVTGVENLLKK